MNAIFTNSKNVLGMILALALTIGATATNASAFVAPPTITSVSPGSGPLTAGTAITITGTNLTGTTSVKVGNVSATNVVVVNATSVTAKTPNGTVGLKDVSVTAAGATVTKINAFYYVAPPKISSVSPNFGSLLGGTLIKISGTNFTNSTTVTIGLVPATSIVLLSANSLSALTPAGDYGSEDVAITTEGGTDIKTNGFSYIAVPTIASVSPNSGSVYGGASITITGTYFVDVQKVTIGGKNASQVSVSSPTSLTVTVPVGSVGVKDVSVTNLVGTGTKSNAFTYVAAPTITSVTPPSGPLTAGTAITIQGTNFTGATKVTIGDVAATGLEVVSATSITAFTPVGSAGLKDVSVTTSGGTVTKANVFTYAETPNIISVAPSSGPLTAGTAITISGTNLTGASSVKIGGVAATNVIVSNATTITAKTPAGTAGSQTVEVTTVGGTVNKTNGFTYVPAPTIASVSPVSGPITGGTTITMTGSNLTGATIVTVGGVEATSVIVVSATSITAITPAGKLGTQSISVKTIGGIATKASAFTYIAAPTITTVSPPSGPLSAGTAITITGTNLTGATSVKIDGVAATNLVVSATSITAVTPTGTAGLKDVSVATVGGTTTKSKAFAYVLAPTLSLVSPVSGPLPAGTAITITGNNFTDTTTVKVGDAGATSVVVLSPTSITAVTPAGQVGAQSLSVTTIGGTATMESAFTYVAAPVITSVSPASGPLAAGTVITISGTNFTGATQVTIGNVAATGLIVVSATSITAYTPVGSAGSKDVSVTTRGGTATKARAFIYVAAPTITSVSPSSGPLTAGTSITISGTNLTGASSVKIGGVAATNVIVSNATTITAKTPAGTAGSQTVEVTTVGGTVNKTNGFTYVPAPTIASVSPTSGPLTAGTAITITGSNFTGATSVTVGGIGATSVIVASATSITAITPAGKAGAQSISVTTIGGIATKANAFTYVVAPTITSVSPYFGPSTGKTQITITGTFLTGATSVKIAGVAATSVVVLSSTSITALTPAGTVGAKDVSVTTPGGSAIKANSFTYTNSFTGDGHTPSDANNNGDGSVVASGKGSNNSGKNTTTSGANNSTATENLATAPMGMELYLQTVAQRADAQAQCEDMQTENLVASDSFIASTDATLGQVTTNEKTEVAADSNAVATQDTGVLSAIDLDLNGEPDICQLRRGDLDLNSEIDARDMAILLNMIDTKPLMGIGDLDGNGVIDAADMSVILLQMQ